MGIVMNRKEFALNHNFYTLIIYGFSASEDAVSLNKAIADELLKIKPIRRTMQLETCFNKILSGLPDNTIIEGIDVMFNPNYQIDILMMLIASNRIKPFRLIWPGRIENDRLIYSEEGYPDYRTFEISNYDIVCVI